MTFRGSDIVDLKVLGPENAPSQQTEGKETQSKPTTSTQEKSDASKEESKDEFKGNDEKGDDFDSFMNNSQKFQAMLNTENKLDGEEKSYKKDDFFDDISTSTTERARDSNFDRQTAKENRRGDIRLRLHAKRSP